jgi:hypothetical protein
MPMAQSTASIATSSPAAKAKHAAFNEAWIARGCQIEPGADYSPGFELRDNSEVWHWVDLQVRQSSLAPSHNDWGWNYSPFGDNL